LEKTKLEFKKFSKSARRQALDTVRANKLSAVQFNAACGLSALDYICKVRKLRISRRLSISTVRKSLKGNKNFQNQENLTWFCNPEGVSGDPEDSEVYKSQEKGNKSKWPQKVQETKKTKLFSPVESPILFKDKLVSADTDQSPQIHLDLEQTVTEYYSFPRSKLLNEQEKKDDVLTL
jgi:hypothetical protein